MKHLLLATTALLLTVGGASANELKFFSGTSGYTGDFSGTGTVYNTINGDPLTCAGNTCLTGNPPPDKIGTPQTYGLGSSGLTATATTGGVSNNVWDDTSPAFGGIGVGLSEASGQNDNIDGTDILTLTFNQSVELTGIATLFDPAHGTFDNGNPLTGSFLLNGHEVSFLAANTELLGALSFTTGTTFTFAVDGTLNPSFYVSGLTFLPGASVTPTPLPGAVGLFASGLVGLIGLGRRRSRKRTERAA